MASIWLQKYRGSCRAEATNRTVGESLDIRLCHLHVLLGHGFHHEAENDTYLIQDIRRTRIAMAYSTKSILRRTVQSY